MGADGVEVRRADGRFVTRTEHGTTHHSFSFGEHYDPANTGFGPLLVLNDDTVLPGTGYADHPHADVEILTWVLSGALAHADSTGHRGVVHRGLAQRLSAGAGVVHRERNDAPGGEPLHLVQMWVAPDEPGLPPSYASGGYAPADLLGAWLPVASGRHPDALVTLGSARATLWVSVLAPGVRRTLPAAARSHVYLARGAAEVEAVGSLAAGDALRVARGDELAVTAGTETEVLVWTLAG